MGANVNIAYNGRAGAAIADKSVSYAPPPHGIPAPALTDRITAYPIGYLVVILGIPGRCGV